MASGPWKAPHQQAGHMAAPTSRASFSKKPLPIGSRPHMAQSGLFRAARGTSAIGVEADIPYLTDAVLLHAQKTIG